MRNLIFLLPFIFSELTALGAGNKVKLVNGEAEIRVNTSTPNNLSLEVFREGKLTQSFLGLGKSTGKIQFSGAEATLLTLDFEHDGNHEFLVRTAKNSFIGALWAFRWDPKEKAFAYVLDSNGDRYIPVPLTGSVSVDAKGILSFSAADGKNPRKFVWRGGRYEEVK